MIKIISVFLSTLILLGLYNHNFISKRPTQVSKIQILQESDLHKSTKQKSFKLNFSSLSNKAAQSALPSMTLKGRKWTQVEGLKLVKNKLLKDSDKIIKKIGKFSMVQSEQKSSDEKTIILMDSENQNIALLEAKYIIKIKNGINPEDLARDYSLEYKGYFEKVRIAEFELKQEMDLRVYEKLLNQLSNDQRIQYIQSGLRERFFERH